MVASTSLQNAAGTQVGGRAEFYWPSLEKHTVWQSLWYLLQVCESHQTKFLRSVKYTSPSRSGTASCAWHACQLDNEAAGRDVLSGSLLWCEPTCACVIRWAATFCITFVTSNIWVYFLSQREHNPRRDSASLHEPWFPKSLQNHRAAGST